VAGPRPIHTAFPAALACKLKNECKPLGEGVSMLIGRHKKIQRRFSGFSNWVCAFPLARGDLLGNPRGGKVH
jgi:hypothetical protein